MVITNVSEYEAAAKKKLPKMVYDYYAAGAEDEWTLKENREAFSRILFHPRILVDVSRIDITTTVLGHKISMPIMLAPSAMQKWLTQMVLKDRKVAEQLVRRAERAGFKALVLTVDAPLFGHREADVKNRFILPPSMTLKNFEGLDLGKMEKQTDGSALAAYFAAQLDRSLTWKDIKWLQTITSLPILVKGVLTEEDARLAIQSGAAGIIVSNHGARQLDYVPATITALEDIAKAVKGQIPVYLDGGIRRGTDIFKALALGASGVFVGRPVLFSLAVDGEAGVRKMLQILQDEFELAMALNGCTSVKEITRNHVVTPFDKTRGVPKL
ncbi:hypothetical protein HPP92_018624 [Vanilla planifolia]|uniref:(S)-2-hydroxy-acid oxidase n=1 Tax=Vanilla planifolia TaxID=51239 RepID=A0A835Q7D1_VANPL|nr:hypothetical protein HPP92_018624 [Vanilla planifolia]